jgi:hypothetical protein
VDDLAAFPAEHPVPRQFGPGARGIEVVLQVAVDLGDRSVLLPVEVDP